MKKLLKILLNFWLREKIQKGSFYPFPARFLIKQRIKRLLQAPSSLLPRMINIETTNACNAGCIMCLHRVMKREIGFMDQGLYKKIIDECAALGINDVKLNVFGEPLLDNDICGKIKYAKGKRINNVGFFTNASLLTEKRVKEIIASGLDEIYISVDGAKKETYEKIRKGLTYGIVFDNIKSLLKNHGNALRVYLFFTSLSENRGEIKLFKKIWRNRVDGINICSSYRIGMNNIDRRSFAPCPYLWQRMFVLCNGDVVLCCQDYDGSSAIGNIRLSGIRELWIGTALEQARKLHLSGESHSIALCNSCELNLWPRWITPFRF